MWGKIGYHVDREYTYKTSSWGVNLKNWILLIISNYWIILPKTMTTSCFVINCINIFWYVMILNTSSIKSNKLLTDYVSRYFCTVHGKAEKLLFIPVIHKNWLVFVICVFCSFERLNMDENNFDLIIYILNRSYVVFIQMINVRILKLHNTG